MKRVVRDFEVNVWFQPEGPVLLKDVEFRCDDGIVYITEIGSRVLLSPERKKIQLFYELSLDTFIFYTEVIVEQLGDKGLEEIEKRLAA